MKRIDFSDSAGKFLFKCDIELSKNIVSKVELLNAAPCPLQIRKLKGISNSYRIRIGDYRVIFEIYKESFLITKIAHRKDIYK